ncbi:MAG TPA: polysaccharide biosynthesis tyrosine autokinase [Dehalococcoidia bacterium]|nr:polysaccharide biosynthesis tyrosine autokinase [Dehalococcoidia bacterium]
MDAAQYIAMARRWWWLLIVGALLSVAAYGVAIQVRNQRHATPGPAYAATATFFVSAAQPPAPSAPDATSLDLLTRSYAAIITGPGVAERVIGSLGLALTAADLQGRISVQTPPNTQLLTVTARGATANDAQQLLDGVTHAIVALRQQGNLPGNVQAVDVSRAQALTAPDPVGGQLQAAVLVAIFGILGAAAIVVAFEYATDAVRDRSDASRAAGLPVLAGIPLWNVGRDGTHALAIVEDAGSAVAERYRMLRTAIGLATHGLPAHVLLIAAGTRGAGATTTAANIAATLAQGGRRVALIDADMRAPSLHRLFGIAPGRGLADLLAGAAASVDDILRATPADGVTLVPAGLAATQTAELLDSPRFDALMRALRERFDAVVVDAPPALQFTDATILAAKADVTLLVARGDITRRREIRATVDLLRPAAPHIAGIALNGDPNVPGAGFRGFRVGDRRARAEAVRA